MAVLNNVLSVKFDKPIYLGMCILDYSKLLMYQFYYERINNLWPMNQIIGYDTDSFFLNIETENVSNCANLCLKARLSLDTVSSIFTYSDAILFKISRKKFR